MTDDYTVCTMYICGTLLYHHTPSFEYVSVSFSSLELTPHRITRNSSGTEGRLEAQVLKVVVPLWMLVQSF